MSGRGSLKRRLSLLMAAGFVLMAALAVLVLSVVFSQEQSEQRDDELRALAALILTLGRQGAVGAAGPEGPEIAPQSGQSNLIFVLRGPDGSILIRSGGADAVLFPPRADAPGFAETAGYRFYQTGPDAGGLSVTVGDARNERREALREALGTILFPLVPLLVIGWLLLRWLVRSGLRPLDDLRSEIETRDRGRLAPIDAGTQPEELVRITGTLNDFMSRLAIALDAERQFASNTAHELRTPIATALAQVQRLRATRDAGDSTTRERIDTAEATLKRMARLIERLLQLARAEAGAGPSATAADLAPILGAVVAERAPGPGRIALHLPKGPVMARMDADAFAIVAANLVENALRHGTGVVEVRLVEGQLEVVNGGPLVPPDVLGEVTQRFTRHDRRGDGLGLGLYISATIARQVGGEITLASPAPGRADGVAAWFDFPAG